jgi:Rap1a immunity proteins
MKAIASCLLLVASLVPNLAFAEDSPLTAKQLRDWCTSTNSVDEAGCQAFIAGFVHGVTLGQELAQSNVLVCLPGGSSMEQVRLMTLKEIADHPELLHQQGNFMLLKALVDGFRCKPGEKNDYD